MFVGHSAESKPRTLGDVVTTFQVGFVAKLGVATKNKLGDMTKTENWTL